VAYLEALAHN